MSDVLDPAEAALLPLLDTEAQAWQLFSVARQQALRFKINRDDADDCAMEFVVRLLGDQHPVFADSWLRRCAVNHAKNYRRAQLRRQAKHLPWPDLVWSKGNSETGVPGEFAATGPGPDECLLCGEFWSRLRILLSCLQPLPRQLFLRHHLGGESYPELGAATGKTPDAVRMIVSRAEACLLRVLSRQGTTEAHLKEYLFPRIGPPPGQAVAADT